jgi:hypothetical protein
MSKARDLANAGTALTSVSATELGYLDGVTSAVQTQLDAKTAKSTLTTTGDIYYASAANTPARLGIGSTGNVLTVASGIPSWAAPAGGGKVLQVVTATTATAVTNSTGSFDDTGITATITPTSATSTILIMISASAFTFSSGAVTYVNSKARIMRDATAILTNGNAQYVEGASNNPIAIMGQLNFIYRDSPATTSATTYKLQSVVTAGFATRYQNGSDNTSTITLLEIGA